MIHELSPDEKLFGKWFLIYVNKQNQNSNINITIQPPPGYFYADPFPIKNPTNNTDNLIYVFFEMFDYKRGVIAYLTIDENNKDNLIVSEPKPININIPNHLSYPYLFEDNGALYMIPETCHLNKINLYECISFPDEWIYKKTLIDNVHAADPSIVKFNDKYWLFTLILKEKEYKFCIFYSDSLINSEWYEHSLVNVNNNPQLDNKHLTRNAGYIFYDEYGELIRPAQYSFGGINGESVILYKINQLTEDEYDETPIDIIGKEKISEVRAIHTYSTKTDIIVMDARMERDTDLPYIGESIYLKNNIKDNNYYVHHDILQQAFSLNTSGNGKCYYGATIGGVKYEGERNWDARWNLIKNSIKFDNRNVVDFGCNNGISLVYLKKFRNIKSGLGIEQPDELLTSTNKKDTIKSFDLLKKGFFADDVEIKQIDINHSDYENIIKCDHDIAIAMSILKWIEDKDRFIKYLTTFNHIIYEGHDSDEEEIKRFTNYGFEYKILGKTQTGQSYAPDNTRTLILFSNQ